MQWSWGLDDFNGPTPRTARLSTPAQQMTRNVLARFVGDRFPVANFDVLTDGHAGTAFSFDGQASRDDDGKILHYQWDFGDGDRETGMTASHAYLSAGRYQVTLTVTDDRGAADRTSRFVLIAQ